MPRHFRTGIESRQTHGSNSNASHERPIANPDTTSLLYEYFRGEVLRCMSVGRGKNVFANLLEIVVTDLQLPDIVLHLGSQSAHFIYHQ